MQDEELVRLARSSAKAIRKAKGWRLAAGNLMWVVLSLQAASIGQIPVFPCCLGVLGCAAYSSSCGASGRVPIFSNLSVLLF